MLILGASIPIGLMLGLLFALIAERFGAAQTVRVRVQPAMAFRPAVAAYSAAAPAANAAAAPAAYVAAAPTARAPARAPAVARLPGISDPRAADAVIDWPNSEFARATAALLSQAMRAGKVIAVTGNEWGQAKTAATAALARTAARGGLKVAVIDASLAYPVTGRAFGLGPVRFGLVEALTGAVPLDRAFCRDPRSQAQVLMAAQRMADPTAVLASARMARLVAYLRRACDLVIIDAPPLTAPGQLAAVRRLVDATVAVDGAGRVELR
jgi:Mrp family chromosome partitioning ATPase